MENKENIPLRVKVEDLDGYITVSRRTFYKIIKEQEVSYEDNRTIVLFLDILESGYPKLYNRALRELKWNYQL